ncbi:MAG TPA: CBS domain-containing protein [Pirellulaceae bacterium]|nr:CBS domain-containing protein [Pirellulaceae bacterium]
MDFQLNLNTDTVELTHPGKPLLVGPQTSIAEVLELLKAQNTGSVLVCRDGVLVGVFTERDALRVMASGCDFQAPIATVMTPRPVTVHARETISSAINRMASGGYRRLPMVNDRGRPIGMLKVSGILRYLVEHFPRAIYTLPPEPHQSAKERDGA